MFTLRQYHISANLVFWGGFLTVWFLANGASTVRLSVILRERSDREIFIHKIFPPQTARIQNLASPQILINKPRAFFQEHFVLFFRLVPRRNKNVKIKESENTKSGRVLLRLLIYYK